MTDPGSLTERLAQSAMEAKVTLQQLHIAAKDMRTLLREVEQTKRDMRNVIENIAPRFASEVQSVMEDAKPQVAEGVQKMIDTYAKELQKAAEEFLTNLNGSIVEASTKFKAELDEARNEFRQSKEASENARAHAHKIADLMDKTHEDLTVQVEKITSSEVMDIHIRRVVLEILEEFTH